MAVAITPALIAGLAGKLLSLIKETQSTDIPTEDQLKSAVIKLLDGQGLVPAELLKDFAPARALFLLESMLDFNHLPSLVSASNLEKLLKICPGTPRSSPDNPLPANRATIPNIGGAKTVDYVYQVDTSVLPPGLGVTAAQLGKMVEAAWFLWQKAVLPNGKIRVLAAADGLGPPNLVIRCGALDGAGNTLGVTTSTWSSDKSVASNHVIVLDMSEQWTRGKLMACLTHEMGHALGLEHVSDPNAIMAASLNPAFNDMAPIDIDLTATDKLALRDQHTPWV